MCKKLSIVSAILCMVLVLPACGKTAMQSTKKSAKPSYVVVIPPSPSPSPTPTPLPIIQFPDFDMPENIRIAYQTFLQQNIKKFSQNAYTFVYINDDNIPELAISDGDYETGCGTRLYTYTKNGVEQIVYDEGDDCYLGRYGKLIYKERKGLIYICTLQRGHESHVMYKMEGTQVKPLHDFYTDLPTGIDESEATYKVDDVSVSQKEYEQKYKQYGFDDVETTFRHIVLKDYFMIP